MNTIFAVILMDMILVTLGITVIRLSRHTRRELAAANARIDTLQTELGQIYLTDEDRELLGLEARKTVTVPDVSGKAKRKGLVPACQAHAWSAEELKTGRLPTNRTNRSHGKGLCFIRTCIKCEARQARGVQTRGTSGERQSHYTWHAD